MDSPARVGRLRNRLAARLSLGAKLAWLVSLLGMFVVGAVPQAASAVLPMLGVTAFVLALQSVIYTYDGWTGVVYFGEEVQEPGKAIPRSLFGGVLSMAVLTIAGTASFPWGH